MTSKLIDINKNSVHEQCSELVCNLMCNLERHYFAVKLHFLNSDTQNGASLKRTPTFRDTIPIYLHQDYNYMKYGKCDT